jgi:carboxypeptidase D
MVPYDLPQASHDMMLRFMGVDITQLASGSAKVPSKVGNDTKPALQPTLVDGGYTEATATKGSSEHSPEQDKAMWEGTEFLDKRTSKYSDLYLTYLT